MKKLQIITNFHNKKDFQLLEKKLLKSTIVKKINIELKNIFTLEVKSESIEELKELLPKDSKIIEVE